jgi:hypothetical protein
VSAANSQAGQVLQIKVKVKVTLRLAVYRQSIHLGVKPVETHDQIFFQLNSCGNSPYVASSLQAIFYIGYKPSARIT